MNGEVKLDIKNFQPDIEVEGSKMKAAEIVIDDIVTPCIIRYVAYGSMKKIGSEVASLTIFERLRNTAHTRKGFVDVRITTNSVQLSVYIHTTHLERFFDAYAMTAARVCLGI